MKILAVEKAMGTHGSVEYEPHLKSEAAKVLELYENGIIREVYFSQDHEAVIVLECADIREAEAVLGTLPLVENNLITFDFMELNPYKGFTRLVDVDPSQDGKGFA